MNCKKMKIKFLMVLFILLSNVLRSQSFTFDELNNALNLSKGQIEELPLTKKFKFLEAKDELVAFYKPPGETIETVELFEYFIDGSGLTYCTLSLDYYLKIKHDMEKSDKYLFGGVNALPDGRSLNVYLSKDGKTSIQYVIESSGQNIYSATFKKLLWTTKN